MNDNNVNPKVTLNQTNKLSLGSRFLIAIGLSIFSIVVSIAYIVFLTRNTEQVSWEGFLYFAMLMLVAFLTFIVTLLALSAFNDRRQARLTMLFIATLVVLYPFVFEFIGWVQKSHYQRQESLVQKALVLSDCNKISIYFNWSQCVRKTLHSEEQLAECQQQGRNKRDPNGKSLESVCQYHLSQFQKNTAWQKSADSVDGLKGCEEFTNDFDTWKFCVSAKGVPTRSEYDECYRQARLQPIPTTGRWPMGQYCGGFYKESFGH
jgi:hypothetical protein